MLKTITTTVFALSTPPLASLNFADTYSLSSTENNPLLTKTTLVVSAISSWTRFQQKTALLISPSAGLFSAFSDPTVNPKNLLYVNTQNYTVLFVELNKLVSTSDGLHHQYTPEKYLHQIDAQTFFTMREQRLDVLAYIPGQEMNIYTVLFMWNCFKLVVAISWKFH